MKSTKCDSRHRATESTKQTIIKYCKRIKMIVEKELTFDLTLKGRYFNIFIRYIFVTFTFV